MREEPEQPRPDPGNPQTGGDEPPDPGKPDQKGLTNEPPDPAKLQTYDERGAEPTGDG
jgi:hypothetical protein